MRIILTLFFFIYFLAANGQTYVAKNIKTFGAKGDGKTNDNKAFQKAADFFNKRGGHGKLLIPKGIYIIGGQIFTGGQPNKPAYENAKTLQFSHIKNFIIEGETGSKLKYKDSMRIGAFLPESGKVYEHGNNLFVNHAYAAIPGYCILIENCQNFRILNLDLDGNSSHMIIGGVYGDFGRQMPHYGIFIQNSQNIYVDRINAHHFGLDGICVSNIKNETRDSIRITNSIFEYNSRQGLSWIGGNDLYVENCKFNHTGKGKFVSPPGGGLDIEAEVGPIRNGVFSNCEFIDNEGIGMGADSGDSGDCTFNNCTFWGVSNYSLWVTKPNFTFNDCNIYGSTALGYNSPNAKEATKFVDCHFEDKLYNGKVPFGNFLVESNNMRYISFTQCTFVSNIKKLAWLNSPGNYPKEEKYQLINCSFTINNSNLPERDFVAVIRGATIKNCTFTFTDPLAKTKSYFLGGYDEPGNILLGTNKIIYKK